MKASPSETYRIWQVPEGILERTSAPALAALGNGSGADCAQSDSALEGGRWLPKIGRPKRWELKPTNTIPMDLESAGLLGNDDSSI